MTSSVVIAPSQALYSVALPRQADSDEQLIRLWLHGKAAHTQLAYSADAARLFAFTGRPLAETTLGDLQAFADSLGGTAASQRRAVAVTKSLLTFGQKLGYLPFNIGAALTVPKAPDKLAERILSETDILRILDREPKPRNRALLRFMYATGLRASEVVSLRWHALQATDDGRGIVNVHGKGGKTRTIRVERGPWADVWALRGDRRPDDAVWVSQKGGALAASQVFRTVKKAAARAGCEGNVSPHWMRHAHASHSLDNGAPISLVQATLGHSSVSTTGRYLHARPGESSGRYLKA